MVSLCVMRLVALALIMLAFAVLEVFLGGARVLYAIPGVCLVGLAGLFTLFPHAAPRPRVDAPALFSALLFTGYILVRNRMSEVDYIARLQFFIAAGCLITYLLFSLVLTRTNDRKWLIYALIALALVQVGVGAVQFAKNNQWMPLPWAQRCDESWRATGLFISPNNYAGCLEIIALMGLSLFVWSRVSIVQRILVGYTTICCIAGVAISGSRGGYISLAFGSGALLFLTLLALKRLRPKKFALLAPVCVIAGVLVISGVLALMFQSQTLRERLFQINDPSNMRLLLWSSAIDQFQISPVVGTGGFSFLYYGRLFRHPSVQNDPIHTHNDYVQLLADYGMVGAILFAALLAAHLVAGGKQYRRLIRRMKSYGDDRSNTFALCIGSLSAIVAYMAHSAVDFNMQLPANALLIAVLFAILANANTSSSKGQTPLPRLVTFSGWLLPALSLAILIYGLALLPGEYFTERARFALVRLQQPAAALEFARQGFRTEKKNPDLYYYAGEAALQLAAGNIGNPMALRADAIRSFTKGLEAFPYDSRLAVKLAQAYSESGNYFEAAIALSLAEKWDPNSSFVAFYRGLIEHAGGYDSEAEAAYQAAISLGGEGGDLAKKALVLLKENDARKASLSP